ncbi:MAG: TlyA family RNA methyltransferase [Candidatus Binatia bacterium]|nr:TlyA family RNA methyltransferase [Candidatus Binatia bacterium]
MRVRIDKLLVERGLAPSRERAQRLVLAGVVYASGQRVTKAGSFVDADAPIEVRGEDLPYVSRGGLKLAAALDSFGIDVRGRTCLDVGASTGGFSDCLLQRGATHVYAIDVGYGQLAWKLRHDPRVTVFERTNFRFFAPERLPELANFAAVDVSFISLRLVLPNVLRCVDAGSDVVLLVKPQFEVGREHVGSGGVVRDPELHRQAVETIKEAALALGFTVVGECPSPLLGPKGNREFFLHARVPPVHSPPEESTNRERSPIEAPRPKR